jgi:hypothetical protein
VSHFIWDLNTTISQEILNMLYKRLKIKDGTSIKFSETRKKYRYGVELILRLKDYDNNDLGINFETNYYSVSWQYQL